MGPLIFERFPDLAENLAFQQVAELPTEIVHLKNFGREVGHPSVYIKRDDMSGPLFGGNKVRTLDFLLAAAFKDGGNIVAGLPGTSMALATNIYAKALGIPLTTLLFSQTRTREVPANLGYFQYLGADLHFLRTHEDWMSFLEDFTEQTRAKFGHEIFQLNPSEPPGMVGYVNAAFELKRQVEAGVMPEPDRLYIPLGLQGTSAGLWVGLKAAGMKTRVASVSSLPADDEEIQQLKRKMVDLFARSAGFLRQADPQFPDVHIALDEIDIRSAAPGNPQLLIESGKAWIPRFQALEGLTLDATWTAPAMVEMAGDLENGSLAGKTVLFWLTNNSHPYPPAANNIAPQSFPPEIQDYFEAGPLEDVNQPLFL